MVNEIAYPKHLGSAEASSLFRDMSTYSLQVA